MRVFIVIMALAYWGLALAAQSYLSRGGAAPTIDSAEANDSQEEPTLKIATCEKAPDEGYHVAAGFDAAAEPENSALTC